VLADGGAPIALDVLLPPAPAIRGTVVDAFGRGVAGARVAACEGESAEAAMSDRSGRFELPASTTGCVATAEHARFSSAHPEVVRSEVIIRLATGGAIDGVAIDARGAPVPSFSVTIESFDPADGESAGASRAGEARSELRGRFRFDDLPAGTYVIRAGTAEGLTSEAQSVTVPRGKVVRGVALVLAGAASESESESESESSAGSTSDVAESGSD
jgi:hypothetical protein